MGPRRFIELSKEFYVRDPAIVAKDLLGNILVRKTGSSVLSGKIVETEAYFGKNDPASRACKGKKKYNELMFSSVGRAFIFMVHGNWLLNVVAHLKDHVGAVLIRGIEPIDGIETIKTINAIAKLIFCWLPISLSLLNLVSLFNPISVKSIIPIPNPTIP